MVPGEQPLGPAEAWSAFAAQAGGHVASGPHAGELGTALVSGTEMQEGRKVLEAGQACSVCGVKPGAQCQMLLPVRLVGPWGKKGLTGRPGLKTACVACGKGTEEMGTWVRAVVTPSCGCLLPASAPHGSTRPNPAHLYRGCSEVSEGDRSGMEREVDDRVVAMEAVVASSKDGGVQGRRSGRPVGAGQEPVWLQPISPLYAAPPQELAFCSSPHKCFFCHPSTLVGHLSVRNLDH